MDPVNTPQNNLPQQPNLVTQPEVPGKPSLTDTIFRLPIFLKILLILIFIGIIGIGYLIFAAKFHKVNNSDATNVPMLVKSVKADTHFTVVSVSPNDKSLNNPEDSPIKITFSQPVRPDSLRSYFTVSPMIPGDFTQGDNPNEVIFKAKYTYGNGTSIKVILNKGLQSISGDKFDSDYTFNFYTKILDKSVVFESNSINSRWVNLTDGKDITFNLQVGSDVLPDAKVTIYKGNLDAILSALTYKNGSNIGSNYVTQTYLNPSIDTSKMEKVSEDVVVKNGSTFNFKQGKGLYYIEAKSGTDVVGSTWINVNDQGLIVQQDDQKVIVATQNIKTGDINTNVKVSLYNLHDKPTLIQSANMTNYGELPVVYPQTVDLVVGETNEGIILAPLSIPQTQADIRVTNNLSNVDKIFIYTDKPTYKPSDTIQFRGILRQDNDAKYSLPDSSKKVRVWAFDPQDASKMVIDQTVDVNSSGIFLGSIPLPKSLIPSTPDGIYSLTLYVKTLSNGALYTNSKSYTTFDVISKNTNDLISVNFDKGSYTKNEDLVAHIIGLGSSGKPLANQKLTYTIYSKNYYEDDPSFVATFGNEWGETTKVVNQNITLGSDGTVDVKIDKDDNNVSEAITLEATTTMDGTSVNGAKTVLLQQGNIILSFGPSRQSYQSGDTTITRVYAKGLDGNSVPNLDLNYEIYSSKYDVPSQSYIETSLYQGVAKTDGSGYAIIKQPIETSAGSINIRLIAKDSLGNKVVAERGMTILVSSSNASYIYYHNLSLNNLDVYTDKANYGIGDKANLVINSPYDQEVLISYESGRIYYSQWLQLNKGDNNYSFDITSDLSPSFNLVFSYFNNENLYVEGLPFTVIDPSKTLNITTTTSKSTYSPTDSAEVTIITKDSTGQPASSNISVDIIDDNVFNLRDNLPSGNLGWFFYSPRIVNTNFSASTLGIGSGGGCGGGSGVDIKYVPNRVGTTLYWSPNLSTDQNGQLKINVPLSSVNGKFRILVTGSNDNSAVGQSQSSFIVQ